MCLSFYTGCKSPTIMLNHNPQLIMEGQIDTLTTTLNYNQKKIILEMVSDLSTAPTGSYLNDYHGRISPVVQTFLISKPGYVLFESIAESLKKHNAIVYRQYLASNRYDR